MARHNWYPSPSAEPMPREKWCCICGLSRFVPESRQKRAEAQYWYRLKGSDTWSPSRTVPPCPAIEANEPPVAVGPDYKRIAGAVLDFHSAYDQHGNLPEKLAPWLDCLRAAIEGRPDPHPDLELEEADEEPLRRCESGLIDCLPATTSDSEGVPLCERCAEELAKDPSCHLDGCGCHYCSREDF